MNHWPNNPLIYEINTWVWLDDLSRQTGRRVTLGRVPQAELERLAGYGFDALWLMGVWQRSPAGRQIAREHPGLQAEYRRALPDFAPQDVVGSPYAILDYRVDAVLGSDAELAALRGRLRELGLRLILDFVPNHLAIDHPWLAGHPWRFVQGGLDNLLDAPGDYFRAHGRIFAHGRDPYFPGWTDTAQLDYRQPDTRRAMTDVLLAVAARCDGARCDMAMLVTRDLFLRTWGGHFDPPDVEFWPAAIAEIEAAHPGFLLMAEVYWDMEYALQQQGFDYCYDKRLYDRLRAGHATQVRDHLRLANLNYQRRLVRFIENHDEERALEAFGRRCSQAAALVALALPGARLLHEGQIEGCRLKLPVQLGRRSAETHEPGLEPFYRKLLAALNDPALRDGHWQLLEHREAWPGNTSHADFVICFWELDQERRLVIVNLSSGPAQCYVFLPLPARIRQTWQLEDLLGEASFAREGDELLERGLYLDLPGYGLHLFHLQRIEKL